MNHGIGKLWTRQKITDMVLPSWQETFVTEVFSWANFIMKIQYEPLVKLPDTKKNLCSIQYFIQLLFTLFIFLTHLYAVPLTQTFIDQKWLESKPEPWAKQLIIPAQYTQFRLQGIRIYGISGYMDHFWLVPNRMDFHTI